MTRRGIIAADLGTLLAAAAGGGCKSYLVPFDHRPIPGPPVATRGGDVLEVEDGNLFVRPNAIGPALGVVLENGEDGARVAACLREGTGLVPGDEIVAAAARAGTIASPCSFRANGPTPTAAVRSLADLEVFRGVVGSVHLDLEVRRAGQAAFVCATPRFERRPVPIVRVRLGWAEALGLELCSLEGWPERLLPERAGQGELLVLRVARDSPFGVQGVRPLDTIPPPRMMPAGREAPLDVWFPFLLSIQDDGRRKHLGIGPLDVLFHASESREYNPDTDAYVVKSRWSLFTLLTRVSERSVGGTTRRTRFDPGPDEARTRYLLHWLGRDY